MSAPPLQWPLKFLPSQNPILYGPEAKARARAVCHFLLLLALRSGFFFVRFRKTQGAKLKTFFKTQGSKLKVFSKNSMYRRFFNDFFGKKPHFVANFVCKTQKLCWKLLHFDVKSILWLRKINIYHLILPFLSKNLSIFPETQQFLKLKAKTQGKSKTQG